jgi:hypothetical protein
MRIYGEFAVSSATGLDCSFQNYLGSGSLLVKGLVNHLLIKILNRGPQDILQLIEVQKQPAVVTGFACHRH